MQIYVYNTYINTIYCIICTYTELHYAEADHSKEMNQVINDICYNCTSSSPL